MTWNSKSEIAAEFGLDLSASDEELRSELRTVRGLMHPDKNGGVFQSETDKQSYLRAISAMEFLDSPSESAMALIPVTQLPAIVSAIAQAMAVPGYAQLQAMERAYVVDAHARISQQFLLPKVGSSVFAAITGFLVAFPGNFEKHAILGPLLATPQAQQFTLMCLLMSALCFGALWLTERTATAHADYLMSESALAELYSRIEDGTFQNSVRKISSRQITHALAEMVGTHPRRFSSMAVVEKASAIQIQRLIERKVLIKLDEPAIDTWYKVVKGY